MTIAREGFHLRIPYSYKLLTVLMFDLFYGRYFCTNTLLYFLSLKSTCSFRNLGGVHCTQCFFLFFLKGRLPVCTRGFGSAYNLVLFYASHYFVSGKCQTSFTPTLLRNTTQHGEDSVEASTHQTTTRRGVRERHVTLFFAVCAYLRHIKHCFFFEGVYVYALRAHCIISDVNLEMDEGLHGWGVHLVTAARELLYFKSNFIFSSFFSLFCDYIPF